MSSLGARSTAPHSSTCRRTRLEDSAGLVLDFGYRLIPLVDGRLGGQALTKIVEEVRKEGVSLGLSRPNLRFRNNLNLQENCLRLSIKGVLKAESVVETEKVRAIVFRQGDKRSVSRTPRLCSCDAFWIEREQVGSHQGAGYLTLLPGEWVAAQLGTVMHDYGHLLLSYDDVADSLAELRKIEPGLVRRVVPRWLSIAQLGFVLRSLLKWRIPITNMRLILQSLADHAADTSDIEQLANQARVALLSNSIQLIARSSDSVPVIGLDASSRRTLTDLAIEYPSNSDQTGIEVQYAIRQLVARALEKLSGIEEQAVLLIPSSLRDWLRQMIGYAIGGVFVLTKDEVPHGYRIEVRARLSLKTMRFM